MPNWKLFLDFTCSMHFFHLIGCCIYRSFPTTVSWWLIQLVCITLMVVLGEYLCMRTEMREIPLIGSSARHNVWNRLPDKKDIKCLIHFSSPVQTAILLPSVEILDVFYFRMLRLRVFRSRTRFKSEVTLLMKWSFFNSKLLFIVGEWKIGENFFRTSQTGSNATSIWGSRTKCRSLF